MLLFKTDKRVLLVDDGIAAGVTIMAAVQALKKKGVRELIVAVPTGHRSSLTRLAEQVDAIYCANVREGPSFAVVAAYTQWTDVSEAEVTALYVFCRKVISRRS